jgi:hypothetical protein
LAGLGEDLNGAPASEINRLRVFYGGRGIWYDAERTRSLLDPGVTVGVLHTTRHYNDQLDIAGLIYNYPKTKVPGKDANEIQATKNARTLSLPVFVVVGDKPKRSVKLGWVEDWNDTDGTFLLSFQADPPSESPLEALADTPFQLFGKRSTTTVTATSRSGQQRFTYLVKKRCVQHARFAELTYED